MECHTMMGLGGIELQETWLAKGPWCFLDEGKPKFKQHGCKNLPLYDGYSQGVSEARTVGSS